MISITIEPIENEKEAIQSLYEWYMGNNCAMGELTIKDSEGYKVNLENCSYIYAKKLKEQMRPKTMEEIAGK